MALTRTAVEIPLASGAVVRGAAITGDVTASGRGTILFVHDIGSDLDEFGPLPEVLAALGFDAVAIDLPGHGLSDGDQPEPALCTNTILEVLVGLADRGPLGVVSSGRTAAAAASLGQAHDVLAQLLINPILDEVVAAGVPRAHAVRMVIHGDGPGIIGTETQRFFSYLIGEKMLVFNASMLGGPGQVANVPTVQAHVELFFKRYLNRPR